MSSVPRIRPGDDGSMDLAMAPRKKHDRQYPGRLFRCVCNRYAASRKTARKHCASCGKEQMFRLSDALPWHRQARRLQHKTAGSGRTARLWSLVNSKTVELAALLKWRLPSPTRGASRRLVTSSHSRHQPRGCRYRAMYLGRVVDEPPRQPCQQREPLSFESIQPLLLTSCCSNFWMKTRSVRPLSPQYLSDWRETCSHIQGNSHSTSPRAHSPHHHRCNHSANARTPVILSPLVLDDHLAKPTNLTVHPTVTHIASRAYSSP